jgi:integrase
MTRELIGRNPASLVKLRTPRRKRRKAWTTEQARAVLESAKAGADSLYAAYAAAGVPDISVHDARRTCATLLVDLDVHSRVIMQILRHAQIKVTMEIYSQAPSRQTRDALRRLSESLDS